jgi:hypothetical protein
MGYFKIRKCKHLKQSINQRVFIAGYIKNFGKCFLFESGWSMCDSLQNLILKTNCLSMIHAVLLHLFM